MDGRAAIDRLSKKTIPSELSPRPMEAPRADAVGCGAFAASAGPPRFSAAVEGYSTLADGTRRALSSSSERVGADHRGRHVAMPEHPLDGPDVLRPLDEMGRDRSAVGYFLRWAYGSSTLPSRRHRPRESDATRPADTKKAREASLFARLRNREVAFAFTRFPDSVLPRLSLAAAQAQHAGTRPLYVMEASQTTREVETRLPDGRAWIMERRETRRAR